MGGRRGPIIVPKGHERWGWKILAAEMRKVVAVFDSPPNKIHVVPPKLQPRDSGISSLISMGKDQVAEPGTTTTLPGRNGPFVKDEVYRLQRWYTHGLEAWKCEGEGGASQRTVGQEASRGRGLDVRL